MVKVERAVIKDIIALVELRPDHPEEDNDSIILYHAPSPRAAAHRRPHRKPVCQAG